MGILQRIEEVRTVEHNRLRMALGRADSVLRELEQARLEASESSPHQAIDMFGQPEDAPPAPRMANLGPLLAAWEAFEAKLLERLDTWELELWPLVGRWNRGEDVSRQIRALTGALARNAETVDQLLEAVRVQASFVGETRATMLVVYRAVDSARTAEEQVFPALREGSREAADRTAENAVPRLRSVHDITRSLRERRLPDPDDETEEIEVDSGGFVKQLLGWLQRK